MTEFSAEDQAAGTGEPQSTPTQAALSPRRRAMARATAWTFGSFLVRRLGEAALLLVIGLLIAREDYGNFNAWKAALLPLFLVVAGGWDVVLLRRRQNVPTLVRLLVVWMVFATALLALGLLVGGGWLARWYREPALAIWFRLGGLVLAANAASRLVRMVLMRDLEMGVVARWEIVRMCLWGIGVVAVALGPGGPELPDTRRAALLILAWIVADAVEALGLLFVSPGGQHVRSLWRRAGHSHSAWLRRRATLRREWRFCTVVTLDGLLNALSVGLPVYLIGRQFGGEEIAFFAFGFQFVQIPLYAVLDSAGRVLLPGLRDVRAAHRADRSMDVVRAVSLATMPVLLWAFAAAPDFFTIVLGEDWRMAGLLTRCFVLYLLLAPMTTISGAVEVLTGRPDVGLWWNATTLAGRAAVLWWGLQWAGLLGGMVAYGVFSLLMWGLYQYLIAAMLRIPLKDWVRNYARFAPVWAAMLLFWILWPSRILESRPEQAALLILGGAAGLLVYALMLRLFHPRHLGELLRLRQAFRRPEITSATTP